MSAHNNTTADYSQELYKQTIVDNEVRAEAFSCSGTRVRARFSVLPKNYSPSSVGHVTALSVHSQYSSKVSPFHANTAADFAAAIAAAAWSCIGIGKGLGITRCVQIYNTHLRREYVAGAPAHVSPK